MKISKNEKSSPFSWAFFFSVWGGGHKKTNFHMYVKYFCDVLRRGNAKKKVPKIKVKQAWRQTRDALILIFTRNFKIFFFVKKKVLLQTLDILV